MTKAKGLVLRERPTETPLDLRRIAPEVVHSAERELLDGDEEVVQTKEPKGIRAPARARRKRAVFRFSTPGRVCG